MNRKRYIVPETDVVLANVSLMLALSVQEGAADPEEEILVKEDGVFCFEWGEVVFEE